MRTPQSGIFALGTNSHAYLELDASVGADQLVRAVASLREPWTTMGGVNLVAGFKPEVWREAVPEDAPAEVNGFVEAVAGVDGYAMPATQHDAVLWVSGSAYDVVFVSGQANTGDLGEVDAVRDRSKRLRCNRDLVGERARLSRLGR